MNDEVLARAPALVGVMHAGIDERLLDPVAVDSSGGFVGVLLDNREQVAEQATLLRGQLGALDVSVGGGIGDLVDRRTRGEQRRSVLAGGRSRPVLLPGPAQPPRR